MRPGQKEHGGNKVYVIGGTVGGNQNWDIYLSVYEGTVTYHYKNK